MAYSFLQLEDGSGFYSQEVDVQWYYLLEDSDRVSDQTEIVIPRTIVPEETVFDVTVYFRTRSTKAASTPTTIHYRLDCLSTNSQIVDWTSVVTASAVNITIGSDTNQILSDRNALERKQITVKTDSGLSTQQIKAASWTVRNLQGIQ